MRSKFSSLFACAPLLPPYSLAVYLVLVERGVRLERNSNCELQYLRYTLPPVACVLIVRYFAEVSRVTLCVIMPSSQRANKIKKRIALPSHASFTIATPTTCAYAHINMDQSLAIIIQEIAAVKTATDQYFCFISCVLANTRFETP